jgi:ABC-type antimicrobial peptide transport system permease subunit
MVSVVKRVLEFLIGLMLLAMVGSALMANEEKTQLQSKKT